MTTVRSKEAVELVERNRRLSKERTKAHSKGSLAPSLAVVTYYVCEFNTIMNNRLIRVSILVSILARSLRDRSSALPLKLHAATAQASNLACSCTSNKCYTVYGYNMVRTCQAEVELERHWDDLVKRQSAPEARSEITHTYKYQDQALPLGCQYYQLGGHPASVLRRSDC